MSAERFRDLDAVARAGRAFRQLHTTAQPFATDFQLFAMIDEYKQLLAAKGATLPDGYEQLQARADATDDALEAAPRPLVPSHCDPLCENFLDTGDADVRHRLRVLGQQRPDVGPRRPVGRGRVRRRTGRGAAATRTSAASPAAAEVGRMVAYKAMCDLLWTLWGVIQHVNGNPAEDFWAYATGRFERCRTLMDQPEYAGASGRDPAALMC